MEIRNIRNRNLRRFVTSNNTGGLPQNQIRKIADIMAYLIDMEDIDEIFQLKKYKPHRMSGNRAGTFSLHVTANWWITFKHDTATAELYDVDFEDYH